MSLVSNVWNVETVGETAGLAAWTREELDRYPFWRLE